MAMARNRCGRSVLVVFSSALHRVEPIYMLFLAYVVAFTTLTFLRHLTFHSTWLDLGFYDNVMWNLIHGRFCTYNSYDSFNGGLRPCLHVSPILLVIAPVYAVYPSPLSLLFLQTVFLAAGGCAVYWLARHELQDKRLAVGFALSYLLFPALQGINMFDFHDIALCVPLLLFAFYYLRRSEYPKFALFVTLSVMCREEISLIVFMLGLYILVAKRNRALGLATSALGGGWLLFCLFILFPQSSGQNYPFLYRYAWLGTSYQEILKTLLLKPDVVLSQALSYPRLVYVFLLLAPLAFLPLLAPELMLVGFPILLGNMLSGYWIQYSIYYQYSAPLIPLMFASAVCGTRRILRFFEGSSAKWKWVERHVARNRLLGIILALLMLSSICSYFAYGVSPLTLNPQDYQMSDRVASANRILQLIPQNASVVADNYIGPHLSHTDRVYTPLLDPTQLSKVDYMILDTQSRWYKEYKEVNMVLGTSNYVVVASENGIVLYRKDWSICGKVVYLRVAPGVVHNDTEWVWYGEWLGTNFRMRPNATFSLTIYVQEDGVYEIFVNCRWDANRATLQYKVDGGSFSSGARPFSTEVEWKALSLGTAFLEKGSHVLTFRSAEPYDGQGYLDMNYLVLKAIGNSRT